MPNAAERGENYIADATPVGLPEPPVEGQEGLDFSAEERVNPEDLNGGNPP